jgi:ABC-type multidrug transport system ATPase subunit
MLEIINLKNEIFGPVTLEVQEGQSIIVRGPSGSGKTRFMRAIADLDEAIGDIFLNGQDRKDLSAYEWRKRVRFVSADSSWWFDHVYEHFKQDYELEENMSKLSLKPELMNWLVSKLSTGERQRLAFLRAIADEPQILLLDEPTSALDERSAQKLEGMIEEVRNNGTIVFLASHHPDQVKKFGPNEIVFGKEAVEIKTKQICS